MSDKDEVIELLDDVATLANECRDDALTEDDAAAWTNIIANVTKIKSDIENVFAPPVVPESGIDPATGIGIPTQAEQDAAETGLNPDGTSELARGVTTTGDTITDADTPSVSDSGNADLEPVDPLAISTDTTTDPADDADAENITE